MQMQEKNNPNPGPSSEGTALVYAPDTIMDVKTTRK
jgi:hypothetical protein